jgi:prepilin-type N-terminal cleavage/methylation domain-containing protein
MKRAFTLIELLVVIAIIAILAAIIFPVFSRAKAAAKASACISNMRQLGMAINIYLADSDSDYPTPYGNRPGTSAWILSGSGPLTGSTSPACPNGTDEHDMCFVADPTRGSLFPYVKGQGIYKCPVVTSGAHRATGDPMNSGRQRVTYSMNYLFGGAWFTSPDGGKGMMSTSESTVSNPSSTIMLVDEDVVTRNDGVFVWTSNPTTDEVGAMHADGANMVHADTSTRRYPAKALRLGGDTRYRFKTQQDD